MNDAPSAEQLLDAVARVLTDQVLPETSGQTRHSVRVAANLCLIVGRQITATSDPSANADLALAGLLGQRTSADLAKLLDERLQGGNDPEFEAAVADLLYADVCQRVDVAKPGYRK